MYILYKLKLTKDEFGNYKIEPDKNFVDKGAKIFSVKADDTMMKKFLRRCKIADCTDAPRSKRFQTYDDMLKSIGEDGIDAYVFGHNYPKDYDSLDRIMRT